MKQLLVNAPSGAQELTTVADGGGYFDGARVLWDTSVDGPLPEGVQPGGLVRQALEPAPVAEGDEPAPVQYTLAVDPALAQAAHVARALASVQGIEDQLDADLDAIARAWGYKDSTRLASYVNSGNPKWQAEAGAFIAGRDAWWAKAAELHAAWQAGDPIPTYDAVRLQMPTIVRPA